MSYRASSAITAFIKAPYVVRRFTSLKDGVESPEASDGIGDMELAVLMNTEIFSRPGASYMGSVVATLKTATGQNDELLENGERLDEHLQAGTGSMGSQIGLILTRISSMHSEYISGYFRSTGENDFGYKYGTAYLYNGGFMYRVTSSIAVSAELNGRYAKRDEAYGAQLHNTGGSVVYLTPGLRWRLGPQVVLSTNLRVPVIERLNDEQDEGPVFVGEIGLRR
jgi:hypothetical protein